MPKLITQAVLTLLLLFFVLFGFFWDGVSKKKRKKNLTLDVITWVFRSSHAWNQVYHRSSSLWANITSWHELIWNNCPVPGTKRIMMNINVEGNAFLPPWQMCMSSQNTQCPLLQVRAQSKKKSPCEDELSYEECFSQLIIITKKHIINVLYIL